MFTAGIGEHSASILKQACAGLDSMGIIIDDDKNESKKGSVFEIPQAQANVKIMVITTNEELEMAQQTLAYIRV